MLCRKWHLSPNGHSLLGCSRNNVRTATISFENNWSNCQFHTWTTDRHSRFSSWAVGFVCGLALFWPRSLLPSLGPPFWPSSWSTFSLLASGSSTELVSWAFSSSQAFPSFRHCHSESIYPWNLSLVVRYLRKNFSSRLQKYIFFYIK